MTSKPHTVHVQSPLGEAAYFEKTGIARFDLRDPYHFAVAMRWPPFTLLVLTAWLLINVSFALLYAAFPGSIANARPGSLGDAFFFSIETLATVGYGVMAPASTYGHVISAAEILIGMAFTAVVTGLIFVRFSRPRAKILYAANPVVTRYQGKPALMIRIGNGRQSVLTDATVRVSVLITEASLEGNFFGRRHDLTLLRSHFLMFALTWTLVHVIDEASPLASYDPARISEAPLRLFLSIGAHDYALGVAVRDIKMYQAEDIAFGMRYVDAITRSDEGRPHADMALLSVIEPDLAPALPETSNVQ